MNKLEEFRNLGKALSRDELRNILGGQAHPDDCDGKYLKCTNDKQCCPGLTCQIVVRPSGNNSECLPKI